MLIKRCNTQKYLYSLLFYTGVIASIAALIVSTQSAVDNTFLVAIWSLPSYAIITGLYGLERECIAKALFQNRIVLFLGRISLELFLVHQLVIRYVETFARKLNFISFYMYIVAFMITIVVATALHELKSRRMLKG